jgi:MATE family multidrug resistance protein
MRLNTALNYKIWYLAWPMILSNLSVPLVGLVDAAILGHLESARFLAAVAVGSTILSFLYWGFGFLRMGTTGLTAQAMGANQFSQGRLILSQSMILGACLGLITLALSPVLLKLGLNLIQPTAGAEQLTAQYTQIRIFSAPAVLVNYAIIGWFIGQQNTRWPLVIVLLTNGINLLLDLILIIVLGMKSEGAAYASLVAEYGGCCIALIALKASLAKLPGTLHCYRLLNWREYLHLLRVNRHLFIRTLTLLASIGFFTAQGAQQGAVNLAANSLLMSLLMLTAFGLDGLAHAAEALIGHAIGERNRPRFMATCLHCGYWSIVTALLFTLIFALFGPQLLHLLTSIEPVYSQAMQYLPWLVLLPLVSTWSYLLDGIFIGANRSKSMQDTMLFSAVIVYLPCWYFSQSWGNHGLWFAFLAFNAARGLSLGWCFFRISRRNGWWQHQVT